MVTNRKHTTLLAIAALGLVACGAESNRQLRKPLTPPPAPPEPDEPIKPADTDDTAPYLTPLEQPILDPNLKKEIAPKAPAYFFFVDGADPGGRLAQALAVACARWNRATGVRIEVGRGSVNGLASGAATEHIVQWWPRADPPLDGASGRSLRDNWMATQVYVADDMQDASDIGLSNLLTHELGHSLSRKGDHSETGITAPQFSSFEQTPITSESLAWVCEYLLCPVMRPEA